MITCRSRMNMKTMMAMKSAVETMCSSCKSFLSEIGISAIARTIIQVFFVVSSLKKLLS